MCCSAGAGWLKQVSAELSIGSVAVTVLLPDAGDRQGDALAQDEEDAAAAAAAIAKDAQEELRTGGWGAPREANVGVLVEEEEEEEDGITMRGVWRVLGLLNLVCPKSQLRSEGRRSLWGRFGFGKKNQQGPSSGARPKAVSDAVDISTVALQSRYRLQQKRGPDSAMG